MKEAYLIVKTVFDIKVKLHFKQGRHLSSVASDERETTM